MRNSLPKEAAERIRAAQKITFLTGAGVSTPSGIPDYRSLKGVYQGLEEPEYLLSHEAMVNEPEKFYQFVQNLYHPDAQPNVIHRVMAELEQEKSVWVVSQNIDGLHEKAGSQQVINFHGSLYDCHCRKCGESVSYKAYMKSDRHADCGGQIRPNIVLYGEGFRASVLDGAVEVVEQAELIVIVGTSFQVHPFCDLVRYKKPQAKVIVINQTPISLAQDYDFVEADGVRVFQQL
ncbi:NAD-dependent protein deacylase [Enterococcus sp. JM4C]|uniref:NAD-dependent protein deacylase n=1 Tax=Candidatus Enterococcus huntleyi TaxID=1857217 RepID=UPI00137A8542|nr:NAD-dependent protein deacylase [Enterococcus sp. JM4C]KAF1299135.1 NAD-dependent protein deacylase [Enterococcus sp. JM4C]